MARDFFTLEFEELQPGRWVMRKQVLGVRSHFSWKSKDEVKQWVRSCLQLREVGHDPADLLKHLGADSSRERLSNLGPKGPIPFVEFVRTIYPQVPNKRGKTRNQLGGWTRERQRSEQLLREASFSSKLIHEIQEAELRRWLDDYIRKSVKSKLGNTEHAMQQLVRNIFSTAVREHYLLHDTASKIRTATILPAERPPVTLEDVALIAAKANPELRARLHLGVYAGLEPFEQDELTVGSVAVRAGWLALPGSPPKRCARQMWIHPSLECALKPLLNGNTDAPLFRDKKGEATIFPYRDLKKLCLSNGVEPFIPLSLRDFFKEMLERAGVSDNTIEFLLGHRLERMRRFYSRVYRSPEMIEEAISRLPPLPTVTKPKKNVLGRAIPSAR